MKIVMKMWKGEYSLERIFLVGWALPIIVAILLGYCNFSKLLLGKSTISLMLYLLITVIIPVLFLIYLIVISIATWRSATNYQGKKWRITAKVLIILFWIVVIGINTVPLSKLSNINNDDPGKNSHNIVNFLIADSQYPYIGFWKNQCDDDFGLSVNKAGNGFYSVSFCGPGGCFKPNTYRLNTKIIGDAAYKVVDKNTIQVQGLDGFSKYIRCN